VAQSVSGANPDALPDAEPPRIGRYAVNGTTLYAEVRGSGPALLLIPAGGEDAEWWRPVAERLTGYTVVTYDRRGTGRSGREEWPGRGSVQHADDAASLLGDLGLHDVVVFGNSSAGIVALQLGLAIRAEFAAPALVFEPGYLRQVAGGDELHRRMREAAAEHLQQSGSHRTGYGRPRHSDRILGRQPAADNPDSWPYWKPRADLARMSLAEQESDHYFVLAREAFMHGSAFLRQVASRLSRPGRRVAVLGKQGGLTSTGVGQLVRRRGRGRGYRLHQG
jgi:pimeloyl-ACP methyl ester carboxylesterase